jgi:hypothetical protein
MDVAITNKKLAAMWVVGRVLKMPGQVLTFKSK